MAIRRGAWAALLTGVLAGACTYDFDEPFAQTENSGGSGLTSSAGGESSTGGSVASTTGSGGAAGSTGPGGSGGTGGIPPGKEDCTNSMDDDGDLLVDCADAEDCTTHACVPVAPPTFTGPVVLITGPYQGTMCPAGLTGSEIGGTGSIDAPAAVCEGCSCGAPTCGVPNVFSYNTSACGGTQTTYTPAAQSMCAPFSVVDLDSLRGAVPQATGCPPAGGATLQLPPISWSNGAAACGGTLGGGCSGGTTVCAPKAPGGAQICVSKSGPAMCPPEYPNAVVVYGSTDDTRDCNDCSCALQSANCTGTTSIYPTVDCSGPAQFIVPHDTSCQSPLLNAFMGSFQYQPGVALGSCMPSGGAPTGRVTGSNPETFCCLP